MKRDMELQTKMPDRDLTEINYHMDCTREVGFIDSGRHPSSGPMFGLLFMSLTMSGHDFLDTMRSREVWRRTKAGATKLGSFSLQLLLELGKGYAKEIGKELGLPIA